MKHITVPPNATHDEKAVIAQGVMAKLREMITVENPSPEHIQEVEEINEELMDLMEDIVKCSDRTDEEKNKLLIVLAVTKSMSAWDITL